MKGLRSRAEVLVVGIGGGEKGLGGFVEGEEVGELIGVGKIERAEEGFVHGAEDGGVGADAEG